MSSPNLLNKRIGLLYTEFNRANNDSPFLQHQLLTEHNSVRIAIGKVYPYNCKINASVFQEDLFFFSWH